MCYSVASSLRTSAISLIAIIYLITSGIPKFQYLGVVLIGWCAMQFAEALIWMTDPSKCTTTNKILTLFLIPLVLMSQPLGPVWGSLYLEPWKKNKNFIIGYTIFIILYMIAIRYILPYYFYKFKSCTTITKNGHLNWFTYYHDYSKGMTNLIIFSTFFWAAIIFYPLLKFWPTQRLWPFYIIPLIGIFIGFYTDAPGSIWCYITSYGSISAIILLFLYKRGYDLLK
jgi:hypothetical protein